MIKKWNTERLNDNTVKSAVICSTLTSYSSPHNGRAFTFIDHDGCREIKLPVQLLKDHRYKLKPFAFYCKIKALFSNCTLYNKKSVAIKLGISEYLCKKYIKEAIKLGIIREHCGNYTSVSSYKIWKANFNRRTRFVSVFISGQQTLSDIEKELKFILLKENILQQQYRIGLRADLTQGNYRKVKRQTKLKAKFESKDVIVGYRKLGELTGLSLSSGKKFLEWCKAECKIKAFAAQVDFVDGQYEKLQFMKKKKGLYYYYSIKNMCIMAAHPTRLVCY
jgi:hypothetical protein